MVELLLPVKKGFEKSMVTNITKTLISEVELGKNRNYSRKLKLLNYSYHMLQLSITTVSK